MTNKNYFFRTWFYFRQGWSVYFAFIFAGINTLFVTYYLAIENIPTLKQIFPDFWIYMIIIVSIGIPSLTGIGYFHFKKSSAFKAEADVNIEANPHQRRLLSNTEVLINVHSQTMELLLKLLKNEKISDDEIKMISDSQKELKIHMKGRTV